MRETRSPSMSREDRAEHGMWPGGERDCPLARELDRDRSLVARRIDLDADAHGRARPAIDHDAARALARLSAEQARSEEHTSELQSQSNLVCRLLLEKKKTRRP